MSLQCTIDTSEFGYTPSGELVHEYRLNHRNGLTAKIIDYGGILRELHVPDAFGNYADIVLGFHDIGSYINEDIYAGAIVGRIAGRFAKGKYDLNGQTYQLAQNNGTTHLHGGSKGFDKRMWNAAIIRRNDHEVLELKYHSPDGEEGYPGNLNITVTYSLTDQKGIRMDYMAKTDKATPLCPTQHSYFNLAGNGIGDICNHILQINADSVVEVDQNYLPTGNSRTTMADSTDFQQPGAIKKIANCKTGNHSHGAMYVLKNSEKRFEKVASVYEPKNGRAMQVYTDAPGMQLYTGSLLDCTAKGKSGRAYKRFSGFCLECQGFSDALNHETFESIMLYPEEVFTQATEYRFDNLKHK